MAGAIGKYNEKTAQAIAKSIALGANKKDAAICAGIGEKTLYDWLARYPEFSQLIEETEAEKVKVVESKMWELILAKNPKVIMWYLERIRPEVYRLTTKSETEVSGTLNIQQLADAIVKAAAKG